MTGETITVCAPITLASANETALQPPRSVGQAQVSSRLLQQARGATSVLGELFQTGALRLVFPHGRRDLEAVMVNTSGGITGGDRFEVTATAEAGSQLTITTQAAERAYRAPVGQIGQLTTNLRVEEGAFLRWLPQETLIFEGSAFRRRLSVDLAETARFLMVEPLVFGRTAMGETVHNARLWDRIALRRNGVPIYLDGLEMGPDIQAELNRPAVAGGGCAMASVVFVSPTVEALIDPLRELLPETGGASLLGEDVMALRIVARDGFQLRKSLVPILDMLTEHSLPRSWRL
ncbi:urease accessory protein UreD [Epibacterium sp. SM1979]|uniref:Urease accessory protein UreD n=1 Tax=Tritonibacter litoralis TaxID=2662264 RepID=A0A843YKL4_9RHOB|nr:urease accessory protein UreD [Tritonibacter litoralis]MQQ10205.1 urease accessory protein UreD [Tritonibacter litoralis]